MVKKIILLFGVLNIICLSLYAITGSVYLVDSLSQMPVGTDSIVKIKNQNLMRLIDREENMIPESTQKMMDAAARMNIERMKADSLKSRALQNLLFMPVVFKGVVHPGKIVPVNEELLRTDEILKVRFSGDAWVYDRMALDSLHDKLRYSVVVKSPASVKYSIFSMPVVPMIGAIEVNPLRDLLKIEDISTVRVVDKMATGVPKIKPWITKMVSFVQFSQTNVSENWSEKGTSHIYMRNRQEFEARYVGSQRIKFENYFSWKTGIASTDKGSLRPLKISEDEFKIKSAFGIKAFKSWNYTIDLDFETRFFNTYENVQSAKRTASFLSPAKLSLGVGMNYNMRDPRGRFDGTVTLLAINYKITSNKYLVPPDDILKKFGPQLDFKFRWDPFKNIRSKGEASYFTSFKSTYFQYKTDIDFILNRFFSASFSIDVRYDDSVKRDPGVSDWFLFETFALGFNYRW